MTRTQFKKDVARWIKTRRALLGMTQRELAREAGLTQDWISHFEGGRRTPDSFAFYNIQKTLGRYA